MKEPCDYCEWAALYYCSHPRQWIQPFRYEEKCEFFKALPNNETRSIVKNELNCSKCKKIFHINDLVALDKGSKMLCKNCYKPK